MNSQELLIAGLKSNESGSQQEFWETYFGEMYSICSHILGYGADANDTATDLLTDFMFDYVFKLSNPQALRSYLRLMAVRRSIKRKQQLYRTKELHVEFWEQKDQASPEDMAGMSFLANQLPGCLKKLTPKAQSAIRLKFQKHITNEKIGNVLGGSKQYIGRLIRKSLEQLRFCLERGELVK